MQAWQTQSLVTLAITAVVVLRFVMRELRARIVRSRTLWLRPAFLLAILGFFIFGTLRLSQYTHVLLALALVVGVLCGALTGVLVVRSTTFTSAGMPGAVRVHGTRVTAAVWVGAILLRLIARLFVPHNDPAIEFALNSGLIALVAVAFTIVAFAFHRAIDRLAGTPDAASSPASA
jgi:hypothetical protein